MNVLKTGHTLANVNVVGDDHRQTKTNFSIDNSLSEEGQSNKHKSRERDQIKTFCPWNSGIRLLTSDLTIRVRILVNDLKLNAYKLANVDKPDFAGFQNYDRNLKL